MWEGTGFGFWGFQEKGATTSKGWFSWGSGHFPRAELYRQQLPDAAVALAVASCPKRALAPTRRCVASAWGGLRVNPKTLRQSPANGKRVRLFFLFGGEGGSKIVYSFLA